MPPKQGLLFKMFGIPKPVVFTLVVAALVGTFVLQNGVNAEVQFLWLDKVVPVWLIDSAGVHRFHERPCKHNLIIRNRDRELGLFLAERYCISTPGILGLDEPIGETINPSAPGAPQIRR